MFKLHVDPNAADSVKTILAEVEKERIVQRAAWGDETYPGYSNEALKSLAAQAVDINQKAFLHNDQTWVTIFTEACLVAMAEDTQETKREKLIKAAETATAWIEDIDRRPKSE